MISLFLACLEEKLERNLRYKRSGMVHLGKRTFLDLAQLLRIVGELAVDDGHKTCLGGEAYPDEADMWSVVRQFER